MVCCGGAGLPESAISGSSTRRRSINTAWDLTVSPRVTMAPEPTAEELEVLHAVDVTNVLKRK
jgi:hypothetical protein